MLRGHRLAQIAHGDVADALGIDQNIDRRLLRGGGAGGEVELQSLDAHVIAPDVEERFFPHFHSLPPAVQTSSL